MLSNDPWYSVTLMWSVLMCWDSFASLCGDSLTHEPRESLLGRGGGRWGRSVFCSSQAFRWLDEAHPHMEGNLPYSKFIDLIVNLIQKTSSQTYPKQWGQISGHPVAQVSWHIQLTVTESQVAIVLLSLKDYLDLEITHNYAFIGDLCLCLPHEGWQFGLGSDGVAHWWLTLQF